MAKKTSLYDHHIGHKAKMVDFGGWDMPLHYGSQLQEHHQVRHEAGLFDVSHMTRLDVMGVDAREYLSYLLANDVARLHPGKALYSCMLNKGAGILDDLIVYDRGAGGYRLVSNAATHDKVLAWMQKQARGYEVTLQERQDLAMLAVQGPQAIALLGAVLGSVAGMALHDLQQFGVVEDESLFIARTGYTGEDGVEIMLPATEAAVLWERLLHAGIHACGLGARDTLRLEAGMNLYGSDMDESTSPLVCGLGWTVAWEPPERKFIGRTSLETQRRDGIKTMQIGLVLEERGVLRARQRVVAPSGATGIITSGTFSPTLGRAIGLARVPADIGESCQVDIRRKYCQARVVKLPFVRHGRCLIELPVA